MMSQRLSDPKSSPPSLALVYAVLSRRSEAEMEVFKKRVPGTFDPRNILSPAVLPWILHSTEVLVLKWSGRSVYSVNRPDHPFILSPALRFAIVCFTDFRFSSILKVWLWRMENNGSPPILGKHTWNQTMQHYFKFVFGFKRWNEDGWCRKMNRKYNLPWITE